MLIAIIFLISVSLLIYIKFRNFSFKYSLNYFIIHIRFLEEHYKYCRFLCCCSVAKLFPTLCNLHGLQHTRPPCPSPSPSVCSNACPSSRWCHPTISFSVVLLPPSVFPSIRVFSNESALLISWPKYWSFSFSTGLSNEHPGLVSFRMDWLDLLAVQGTLKESSPTPQFKSINSSALNFLYCPTLTSIHDYWKNHSLD